MIKPFTLRSRFVNRHIRHGFNATVSGMENGDVTTGQT